jgi:hypothetical protein
MFVQPLHGHACAHCTTVGHCATQACCEAMSGWAKHLRVQSA